TWSHARAPPSPASPLLARYPRPTRPRSYRSHSRTPSPSRSGGPVLSSPGWPAPSSSWVSQGERTLPSLLLKVASIYDDHGYASAERRSKMLSHSGWIHLTAAQEIVDPVVRRRKPPVSSRCDVECLRAEEPVQPVEALPLFGF